MDKRHWIFLSPHFDDVALSCGGLVWYLTQQDQIVKIWTILAGYPTDENYSGFAQQNHLTWGMSGREAIRMRKGEDRAACEILGAQPRHLDWPDAIYRRDPQTGEPMVTNNEELLGKAPEDWLVEEIAQMLRDEIPESANVVVPMGLGNHIDHRVISKAGALFGRVDAFYADYPYILGSFDNPHLTEGKWRKIPHDLGQEALHAWQEAVLCYASQLSGFWRDEDETRLALRNYLAGGGGRLWQKAAS
jgi:LmbE family N-acetylglucosaminyl deacetylase